MTSTIIKGDAIEEMVKMDDCSCHSVITDPPCEQVKNVSAEKTPHPCQLPQAMVERIIRLSTQEGQIVLDPFLGSGTTGAAALATGRHFVGIEKDDSYCRIAQNRIAQVMSPLFAEAAT